MSHGTTNVTPIAPQAQPAWGDFRFTHRLRVRWVEVDAQQVVFNGHYLSYLDTAIGDYWRAVGLPYPDALAQLQGDVYVRHHELDYHAPARLDDWLDIGIRCVAIGKSSLTVGWGMWSQGRLLVSGQSVYVFVGLADGRPAHIPEAMRAQLLGFEQGQPPYALSLGDWATQQPEAATVRRAVFIVEQAIDEAEEWDAWDTVATHAVVRNHAGLAVATGRLMLNVRDPHATPVHPAEPGHCRIGRMAVLRSARGVKLGEQVLQGLLQAARQQGMEQAHLNAQCSAQAFYAKAGFEPVGAVFDEVGIPHQAMVLTLRSA
jgi:YbgC/YbaW family acyl-CoA thioester hydrolase